MTNGSGQRLLEADEEQELARRWRELGDRKAADELVISHLRLAAKLAKRYKGYGLPLADLAAEANLGLVIAAARFEPHRGTQLFDLRVVLDEGYDSRLCPSFMVGSQDRHDPRAKEAILRTSTRNEQAWWNVDAAESGSGENDSVNFGRYVPRSDRDGLPTEGRCLSQ